MKGNHSRSSALLIFLVSSSSFASTTFTEIAPSSGITYSRAPSLVFNDIVTPFREASLTTPVPPPPLSLMGLPLEPHGVPGTAIIDYDTDGDLDILVTNGPGAPNHLYQNQYTQTGVATYIETAASAGIDTVDMDANGVCYGDIDNDNDPDVVLLGRHQTNRLYINNGDGTFSEAPESGLHLSENPHTSCALGDINGDGLLDISIANSVLDDGFVAIFFEPFDANYHNQLFLNNGDHTFTDVSERIQAMENIPQGNATITWATTLVDIDMDGDQDIVYADDAGGIPTTKIDPINGVDRAFIHVMLNDGDGFFTPHAIDERPESPGSWMGLGTGDFNQDGLIDIFGSNFGDYGLPFTGLPYTLGDQATRPLIQNADHTFADPDLAGEASVFGWGNAVFDFDNDGDSDVVYHGGLQMHFFSVEDNPGVALFNDGTGNLIPDVSAMAMRHQTRSVHGVAGGDLNRDGFVDVVSVSGYNIQPAVSLLPTVVFYGSVFDATAAFAPIFAPVDSEPGLFSWIGVHELPGDLSIEQNNGDSGYGSITVKATGSAGLLDGGNAPRDGTGAVFTFAPKGLKPSIMPITSGSSHTSAHAQEAYFGLGERKKGVLEVLWPGGVKNRLYSVKAGEMINFPEIPCSYDSAQRINVYLECVGSALGDLINEEVLTPKQAKRFLTSAITAYFDN